LYNDRVQWIGRESACRPLTRVLGSKSLQIVLDAPQ
jgi:hypothetical protein